jgi:exodeoxyribonuclease VII large subunit
MTDLFAEKKTDEPWGVSVLALAIKQTIEGRFGEVRVRGELGRVTKHSSGHIYFDLKDMDSVIHAAWFKGAQRKSSTAIEQGLEVIVTGKVSTYPARSEYQLIVTSVEPAGVGALLKLIEDRRKKLLAEGLFDERRKKPLPFLPRTIGIITSPTGAVIQDIAHRLRDRFMPQALLWPVVVQGEQAAGQVIAALQGFNALKPGGAIPRPDVIIIARGGGSVEDLMPFNDEALVRAVAASGIPVISAVGHETDTTLIDYAADRRAPTPTAAAEMAVPVKAELLASIANLNGRLQQAPLRMIAQYKRVLVAVRPPAALLHNLMQRLDDRTLRLSQGLSGWLQKQQVKLARLALRSPREQLVRRQERLTLLSQRLSAQAMLKSLEPQRAKLQRLGEKLEVLSYRNTLGRGFAVISDEQGRTVTSATAAVREMTIIFADGAIRVQKI